MDISYLLIKAATLQRGAALFLLTWLATQAFTRLTPRNEKIDRAGKATTHLALIIIFISTATYAAAYIAYPIYFDHVEASVVVLGEHVRRGMQLYPSDLGYAMDGLLYGPLLATINALVLSLPIDVFLGTKVVALGSTIVAVFLCATQVKDRRALILLGMLGTFDHLFFNRAEPYLLFLAALACRCASIQNTRHQAWLIGLVAGLASSLKMHGLLYIAAIYIWMRPDVFRQPKLMLRIVVGALITASPWFLLPGISLIGYFHFLNLASQHGIQPRIVLDNSIFLLALWLPLLTFRPPWRAIIGIVAIELLVAVLGAKKGAGCWHLLPFVVLHTHMLDQLICRHDPEGRWPRVAFAALVPMFSFAVSTVFTLAPGIRSHLQQRHEAGQARIELSDLAARHSQLVLAPGGTQGYELTYMRIDLERMGIRQIDVPAFVDLQWAGVSDNSIAHALRRCLIPHVAVPKNEPAFANISGYTGRPLFSDPVRRAFSSTFHRISTTAHFDLYKCIRPLA